MKTTKSAFSGLLLIVLLFSNCAVNRKIVYNTVKTEIASNSAVIYSLASHDQRENVIKGTATEKFVGYMRSTAFIPYPLGTASDINFSDEFSEIIKKSLKESTNQALIIKTNCSDSKQIILDKLIGSKSDRLLLFTITKWLTDSKPMGLLYGTDVIWDITLEVYNNKGELLASNRVEGIDPDLDKSLAGSVKKIQKIVNVKLKEKIDLLFNDPNIKKALNLN